MSSRMGEAISRAREVDDSSSRKRAASRDPEVLRGGESKPPPPEQTREAMTTELEKEADIFNGKEHPLKALYEQVQRDLQDPTMQDVEDHGTWSGKWPLPSRSNWRAHS